MEFSVTQLLLLAGSSLLAGMVDAMGGGGGLISAPAMLAAGVPPVFLLGTNKGMAAFGSTVGFMRYYRAGLVPKSPVLPALIASIVVLGALGAWISTHSEFVSQIRFLLPAIVLFVLLFVCYGWWKKAQVAENGGDLKKRWPLLCLVGLYDGLFGPGSGIFFLSILEKSGFSTLQANAATKVFNLASNAGALVVFSIFGKLIWQVSAGCMACYAMGSYIGSGLVLKKGQNTIRITVVLASVGLILKILFFN